MSSPSAEERDWWSALRERAGASGLAVRGACHLGAAQLPEHFAPGSATHTLVLLGFTGSLQWPRFAASAEAQDGKSHPLDRWSHRLIDKLALELGARAVYPDQTPVWPFQRLAQRCEAVHPSPLGLLIHPEWGLWHAYRGALLFEGERLLEARARASSPCTACAAKPCLGACPVGAIGGGTLDVRRCIDHVQSDAGSDCREHGCRARRACPVGAQHRYGEAQARFHQDSFVRSARSSAP